MPTMTREQHGRCTRLANDASRSSQSCGNWSCAVAERHGITTHYAIKSKPYTSPAVTSKRPSDYTELWRSSADTFSASSHSSGVRRMYSGDLLPRTTSSVRTTSTMSVPGTSNIASSSIRSFTQQRQWCLVIGLREVSYRQLSCYIAHCYNIYKIPVTIRDNIT